MRHIVRISSLRLVDIFVGFAFFVMQDYLTDVWKLNFTHAAAIMNFWNGLTKLFPVIVLFFADAFLGHGRILMITSVLYSLGTGFVAMSTPPVLAKVTGTCKKYEPECIGYTQKTLFYTGMVLVAVGLAGNHVSREAFLSHQNVKNGKQNKNKEVERRALKIEQFIGYCLLGIFSIIGAIVLPYIKPWKLRLGIPAIITLVVTLYLFTGILVYKYDSPKERSPMTNVFRVFVACYLKKSLSCDDEHIYYTKDGDHCKQFSDTRCLRCLHKAAIILDDNKNQQDQVNPRWRLCSMTEVEETKIAVRMIPMWLTFTICGIVSSIGNTYFVEQTKHLNRHWGSWNLPVNVLLLFSKIAGIFFDEVAKYLLPDTAKKAEGTKKKCPSTVVIGMAMVFSILCCIAAALVEERRLNTVRKHGLLDKPNDKIPMSMYWVVFQFILLAGLNSFLKKGIAVFYAVEAPSSLRDNLQYLTEAVTGLGFMLGVATVSVVGEVSKKVSKQNWFQDTLNKSRLDRYYWVLMVMSVANLVIFIVVAYFYTYQKGNAEDEQIADEAGDVNIADGDDGGAGEDVLDSVAAVRKSFSSVCFVW